jgi:hypothetical protein
MVSRGDVNDVLLDSKGADRGRCTDAALMRGTFHETVCQRIDLEDCLNMFWKYFFQTQQPRGTAHLIYGAVHMRLD